MTSAVSELERISSRIMERGEALARLADAATLFGRPELSKELRKHAQSLVASARDLATLGGKIEREGRAFKIVPAPISSGMF